MPTSHPYTLIRSRRRSIALIISLDATLTVRAPLFTPRFYINKLLAKKSEWIVRKQNYFRKHIDTMQIRSGKEQLYFLGAINLIHFKNKKEMVKWYREKAREIITERMQHYSRLTGWKYTSISINSATTRWGSCGSKNTINFSWRLVMKTLSVIDYVVVHELAHTVEKNHSHKFWDKVGEIMPDYKERRALLRQN